LTVDRPLLFALWTTHRVVAEPRIQTSRVRRGSFEYNPAFISSLDKRELETLLRCEATRILLKHPYQRRKENPELVYQASNITLQEYLRTTLPLPSAQEVFGHDEYNQQYFEFYYYKLIEQQDQEMEGGGSGASGNNSESGESDMSASGMQGGGSSGGGEEKEDQEEEGQGGGGGGMGEDDDRDNSDGDGEAGDDQSEQSDQPESTQDKGQGKQTPEQEVPQESGPGPEPPPDQSSGRSSGRSSGQSPLEQYSDPQSSGRENTQDWDGDELWNDRINDRIRTASENNAWGSVAGRLRERVLASLKPKLDYRSVLRQFRTTILSSSRSLTRMKPSRRYGFLYMGSRRDFTTNLLFAVDVSGSISSQDLARGFSVVNRFFKYGIQSIDVIQFDTEIKGKPMTLKKARHNMSVLGRGGTDFQDVVSYVDEHPGYDGLIIFTDGFAPVPAKPKNKKTRVLWLFNLESNYNSIYPRLKHLGPGAFLKED